MTIKRFNWNDVGYQARRAYELTNYPTWKVFRTHAGYELVCDTALVRRFKYLKDAKQYAQDCIAQSSAVHVGEGR